MSKAIYDEIKYIIQDVTQASSPTDLVEGTVVSTSPMKVEIDGNSELYPSSTFLIPQHLTDYEVQASFTGTDTSGDTLNFDSTITIKNSLKVGDLVYILKCQNGQRAFILDRKV